jgi:hypothetical protein
VGANRYPLRCGTAARSLGTSWGPHGPHVLDSIAQSFPGLAAFVEVGTGPALYTGDAFHTDWSTTTLDAVQAFHAEHLVLAHHAVDRGCHVYPGARAVP